MIVTQQPTNLPNQAEPTDFTFLYALIDELKRLPMKKEVFFPTTNRSYVPADVCCKLSYNDKEKPIGEFYFNAPSLGLEMAHTAVVSYIVEGGLVYKLEIRPNKRLRSNKHKSIISTHTNARDAALAIYTNYTPGSVGRKVINTHQEKQIK